MSERQVIWFDRISFDFLEDPVFDPSVQHPLKDLVRWIGRCAIANGCFDLLHPGHLSLLATLDTVAYRRGIRPFIAMNSDRSVRGLKGPGRPIVPEESRSALLTSLKWPFTVIVFDDPTPQRLMDMMRPTVVMKGAEYPADSVVRWAGSEVVSVDMVPRWSTTRIAGDTR